MSSLLPRLWRGLPLPLQDALMGLVNPRFLVGATAAAFDGEGRVLLYRHTYRTHAWGLPAGWLHRRESLEECIRREVWEEGRLRVEPLGPGRAFIPAGRGHVEVVFLCQFLGGEFTPSLEVDGFGLYPLDDLPDELLPTQRPLIAEMGRRYRSQVQGGD